MTITREQVIADLQAMGLAAVRSMTPPRLPDDIAERFAAWADKRGLLRMNMNAGVEERTAALALAYMSGWAHAAGLRTDDSPWSHTP